MSSSDRGTQGQKPKKPSLSDQIRGLLKKSHFEPKHPDFLPNGSLDGLITKKSIRRAFWGRKPSNVTSELLDEVVNYILAKAEKLFAISLLAGLKDLRLFRVMQFFMYNDICDGNLPFSEEYLKELPWPFIEPEEATEFTSPEDDSDDTSVDGSSQWDDTDINNFMSHQWEICVPVFSANKTNYDIDQQAILPFIEKHTITGNKGAFGEVMRCMIHEKHLDAQGLVSSTVAQSNEMIT